MELGTKESTKVGDVWAAACSVMGCFVGLQWAGPKLKMGWKISAGNIKLGRASSELELGHLKLGL